MRRPCRFLCRFVMSAASILAVSGCLATGEDDGPGAPVDVAQDPPSGEEPGDASRDETLDENQQEDQGGDADLEGETELPEPTDAGDTDGDGVPENDLPDSADAADLGDETTIRGSLLLPFNLTIHGRGSEEIGEVDIETNAGTIERDATLSALAYHRRVWEEFDLTLYHVIAPQRHNLHILYLYCGSVQTTSLDIIWHEDYDSAMDWQSASGSCSSVLQSTSTAVELPRLRELPTALELVGGFTVTGEDVSLDQTGGTIVLSGASYDAFPFEAVDCTTECSEDPADGWWELHMALDEQGSDNICFGILYLELAYPDQVGFHYGFCLDELRLLDSYYLDARWSAPRNAKKAGFLPPVGPRHPDLGYVLRPHPQEQ